MPPRAIALYFSTEDDKPGAVADNRSVTRSIFLAYPNCTGMQKLVSGVTRVIDTKLIDKKHALIWYVKGGSGYVILVHLGELKVIEKTSLNLLSE